MSLARLLEQATPGPWWHRVDDGGEWWFGKGSQATIRTDLREFDALAVMACDTDEELAVARLVALAPDMAQLLIDMAAALGNVAWKDSAGLCWCPGETEFAVANPGAEHTPRCQVARDALARFAELNARAGTKLVKRKDAK